MASATQWGVTMGGGPKIRSLGRSMAQFFANHPTLFLLSAALLLWLFVRKSQLLQKEIFRFAEYAWRRVP